MSVQKNVDSTNTVIENSGDEPKDLSKNPEVDVDTIVTKPVLKKLELNNLELSNTDSSNDSVATNAIAEHLNSLKNTLGTSDRLKQSASRMNAAIEVTSFDGETDFDGELELDTDPGVETVQGSSYELSDLMNAPISVTSNSATQEHDQSVDIDVFIPSLLLSFESLLKRVFDDLLNGLKNHNLYSMGLAQYLKLEDEQVNGNVVKLRYRLPIDNVKLVFEAMNH